MKISRRALMVAQVVFCLVLYGAFPGRPFLSGEEKVPPKVDFNKLLNPNPDPAFKPDAAYLKPYHDFTKQIFDKMDVEYYKAVSRETYDRTMLAFSANVLSRIKDRNNVIVELKYTAAALVVRDLKDPTDIYSGFVPPREAPAFKSNALGYSLGIGITGSTTDAGYLVTRVEIRSDSFVQGIRPGDVILEIGGAKVKGMSAEDIKKALHPELNAVVVMKILSASTGKVSVLNVRTIEFLKETLAGRMTNMPRMSCIKIDQFNQKTGEDFNRILGYLMKTGTDRLIIDLRGNGGGTPVSAREIAGFFYPPKTPLFYFQRKNQPKVALRTEASRLHYKGDIALLVDRGTGSSSELFAGSLKRSGRAFVIGSERSAGKTCLKAMFSFEDKSLLYLVTALAYTQDGSVFDTKGVEPDFMLPKNANVYAFAAKCFDSAAVMTDVGPDKPQP